MKRILLALVALVPLTLSGYSQIIRIPSDQPSVQAGIDSASAGDTVLVAEGTYLENINFRGKAITVASQFLLDGDTSHISKTIIDGSEPVHPDSGSTVTMILARDTTSVLCGFTIQGGTGTGPLPGIYGWTARSGGGIIMAGGKVINNRVKNNHVNYDEISSGGGIRAGYIQMINPDTGVNLVIRNNMVFQNSVHSDLTYCGGGGVDTDLNNGYTLIENNEIFENTSVSEAPYKAMSGGLHLGRLSTWDGISVIRNNYIHHNEAHSEFSFGGGLLYFLLLNEGWASNFHPTEIYNNVFANNHSDSHAGGACIWYNYISMASPPTDPVLYNNTFLDNYAEEGSGLGVFDAKVGLFNNIFWDDLPDEGGSEFFDGEFTYCPPSPAWCQGNQAQIQGNNNNIRGGWPGEGNISFDPYFETGSFQLSDSSACIGRGIDSVLIENTWYTTHGTDYEGNKRPSQADPFIDVGAYESDREQVLLPIASLTDIHMYDHTLNPVFDPEIYSYEMGVVDTTFNSMNLKPVPADNLAYVEIQHAQDISSTDVAERTAFIKVTSSDSTIWEEYTVEFYYLSADATLSSLSVAGYDLQPLFHPDTLWYQVLLPPGTIEVPEITYETSHEAAEVTYYAPLNIQSPFDFRRTANIYVDAEDGFRRRIYQVQFDLTTGFDRVPAVPGAVNIFPNPVEKELFIHAENQGPVSVTVLSITGVELLTRPMKGSWTNLDLSSFEEGIYLVTLRTQDSIIIRKIIKL